MHLEREELEYQVLKHLITSKSAVAKSKKLGVGQEHFGHKDEATGVCYTGILYALISKYYDECQCNITDGILQMRMVDIGMKDKHKQRLIVLWERIQEEEIDENEFYAYIIQLKRYLAMGVWRVMMKEGNEKVAEEDLTEAVDFAQTCIDQIRDQLSTTEVDQQSVDITTAYDYVKLEWKRRKDHPEEYQGVYCGLNEIDKRTFGFMAAQLIVLLAPSSGGKSVQMLNWAHSAHLQGKNVLYFSFEMDVWQCIIRHLSLAFKVPYDKLKSLTLDEATELNDVLQKLKELEGGPYFEYEVNMEDPTPEFVDSRIMELIHTKGKPDFVVIDYIGNMTTRQSRRDQKEWEKQGDAVKHLFLLAKRYKIPILTAQQITSEAIKDNRKQKQAGKQIIYDMAAASGDKRLIHYAHYVIGMEPDKENSMVTYYPIKMRDAWFPPFGARWDAKHNGVYELDEDQQRDWRSLKGLMNTTSSPDGTMSTRNTSDTTSMPVAVGVGASNSELDGDIEIEWDGGQRTYAREELEIETDLGGQMDLGDQWSL